LDFSRSFNDNHIYLFMTTDNGTGKTAEARPDNHHLHNSGENIAECLVVLRAT
jgi:hypothetical protein